MYATSYPKLVTAPLEPPLTWASERMQVHKACSSHRGMTINSTKSITSTQLNWTRQMVHKPVAQPQQAADPDSLTILLGLTGSFISYGLWWLWYLLL